MYQNDPGDKNYIIARGLVEVWRGEEQSGNTKRVAVLQAGDFFGEITLITGFPRTAAVVRSSRAAVAESSKALAVSSFTGL